MHLLNFFFNLESYILIPFHLFVSTRQPSHRQAAVLGFSLASASENRLTFRAWRREPMDFLLAFEQGRMPLVCLLL